MAEDYFHIASKIAPKWNLFPALKVGDTVKTGDFNPFLNFFPFFKFAYRKREC